MVLAAVELAVWVRELEARLLRLAKDNSLGVLVRFKDGDARDMVSPQKKKAWQGWE
jgi:hypothetical protein